MLKRIINIHRAKQLPEDFLSNYRHLKRIIDKALEEGTRLEELRLLPQGSDRNLILRPEVTRDELLKILRVIRNIETRYQRLLHPPITKELEKDILEKSPNCRLPWEEEALGKMDQWREDIRALQTQVRKELNNHLQELFCEAQGEEITCPTGSVPKFGSTFHIDQTGLKTSEELSQDVQASTGLYRALVFDVFISYASLDREIAGHLKQGMVEANLKVCLGYQNIISGSYGRQQIRKALESSLTCVVLLSRSGLSSTSFFSIEWPTMQEIAWARNDFVIIPLVIGDAEIPLFLRAWPTVNLDTNRLDVNGVLKKIQAIRNGKISTPKTTSQQADHRYTAERHSWILEVLTQGQTFRD